MGPRIRIGLRRASLDGLRRVLDQPGPANTCSACGSRLMHSKRVWSTRGTASTPPTPRNLLLHLQQKVHVPGGRPPAQGGRQLAVQRWGGASVGVGAVRATKNQSLHRTAILRLRYGCAGFLGRRISCRGSSQVAVGELCRWLLHTP